MRLILRILLSISYQLGLDHDDYNPRRWVVLLWLLVLRFIGIGLWLFWSTFSVGFKDLGPTMHFVVPAIGLVCFPSATIVYAWMIVPSQHQTSTSLWLMAGAIIFDHLANFYSIVMDKLVVPPAEVWLSRLAIIAMALFTSYFSQAYGNFLLPALGFVACPITTIVYALAKVHPSVTSIGLAVCGSAVADVIMGIRLLLSVAEERELERFDAT